VKTGGYLDVGVFFDGRQGGLKYVDLLLDAFVDVGAGFVVFVVHDVVAVRRFVADVELSSMSLTSFHC
jgi:hypothetical protein